MAGQTIPTNGKVIRTLRHAQELRLRDVAESAGISQGYLSKLERDEQDASPAVLRRIASSLSVPLVVLTRATSKTSIAA